MILFFDVFSSSTEMGTKLSIERRYTAAERSSANEDQVVKMLSDWYSNFPFVNRVFIMSLIIMSLVVPESTVRSIFLANFTIRMTLLIFDDMPRAIQLLCDTRGRGR
jgi:hypothetical protein